MSIGPRHHLSFCACNTAWLAPESLVSMGPRGFCMQNSDFWIRITSLYVSLTWPAILCVYKGVLSIRITSLYWSKTLPVVLCMQNSVICTRMTSLYGFQPSSVVLCMQNSNFRTTHTSMYVSQTSSVVFWCKTAPFEPEKHVSMGLSPHLWFLDAKQRLLDYNNKSLMVPHIT